MRIRMFPSIKEEKKIGDFLQEILELYIYDIQLPNHVLELVITEFDQYENAIKEIDSNATYTENIDYVGFGKTIYNQKMGKSSIVIRNNLLITIFENFGKSNQLDDWNEIGLLSIFTIIHEVGHTLDYSTRGYKEKNLLLTMPFRLSKVVNVYLEEILNEIAANVFARKYMNDKYKLSLKSSLISELSKLETQLITKQRMFTTTNSDKKYYELAQEALFPLRIIQEYLIFYDNINNCLTSTEQNRFPYIMSYFEFVKSARESYPNWDKKRFFNILNSILLNIFSHFSIKLSKTPQGDKLTYMDT